MAVNFYFLGIVAFLVITYQTYVQGRVNIVLKHNPPYVQSGSNLTLLCNSRQRFELQWFNLTLKAGADFQQIKPFAGGPYVTRKLYEEPSGYVENTLIKQNVSLADTGSYMCSDVNQRSLFAIYVTVLQIVKNDVRAPRDSTSVELQCKIIGFTTNVPEMAYMWSYKGLRIPESSHPKYATSQSDDWRTVKLVIKDVGSQDTGHYTCMFLLSVSFGEPFNASEKVYLDAGGLPASGSNSKHSQWIYSGTVSLCVVISVLLLNTQHIYI